MKKTNNVSSVAWHRPRTVTTAARHRLQSIPRCTWLMCVVMRDRCLLLSSAGLSPGLSMIREWWWSPTFLSQFPLLSPVLISCARLVVDNDLSSQHRCVSTRPVGYHPNLAPVGDLPSPKLTSDVSAPPTQWHAIVVGFGFCQVRGITSGNRMLCRCARHYLAGKWKHWSPNDWSIM